MRSAQTSGGKHQYTGDFKLVNANLDPNLHASYSEKSRMTDEEAKDAFAQAKANCEALKPGTYYPSNTPAPFQPAPQAE